MKNILLTIVASVALSVFGSAMILAPSSQLIGGLVHNVMEDFTQGISVSGTTVLDSSRNLTGVTVAASDLTASDDAFITDDLTVGAATASISGVVAQFISTATTSIGFDSGSGKGTCLVMYNSAGTLTYVRIVGTTLTANTTSCK